MNCKFGTESGRSIYRVIIRLDFVGSTNRSNKFESTGML